MAYSKLSIVIPIYNEIDTIHEILRQVSAVEIGLEKEIILVDDCGVAVDRMATDAIQLDGEFPPPSNAAGRRVLIIDLQHFVHPGRFARQQERHQRVRLVVREEEVRQLQFYIR